MEVEAVELIVVVLLQLAEAEVVVLEEHLQTAQTWVHNQQQVLLIAEVVLLLVLFLA